MRIKDKIKEINTYLAELESFMPESFAEYNNDLKLKAACERYFEKITQAIIDLAKLILKEKGYKMPEEREELLDVLEKERIITTELSINLKQAKGMRNILAHRYGNIDNEIVFNSITKEITRDAKRFVKEIKKKV